jgi:hypothetical protein
MLKILNPLTGNQEPVASVLRSLAGQENCDGPPYDQMQEASDYIAKLEDWITTIHNLTVSKEGTREKVIMIHGICDHILGHKK